MSPRPRCGVFLSVRNKATRCPGKVLHEVAGQSLTAHLLDRLALAAEPDLVLMATSTHPDDTVLCDLALAKGVHAFRGSEDDKLERYLAAARAFDLAYAVIVDGDDFLVSETHLDEVVRCLRETGADYAWHEGLPFGAASFGVKTDALAEVCRTKREDDTEVWGAYFTQNPRFVRGPLEVEDDARWPALRLTCDYPEDLELVTKVIEACGAAPRFRDVLAHLHAHPELVALNAGAQAKGDAHLKKSPPPATSAREPHPWVRALVVGLGSMGKRRVRCLQELGASAICGFDPREDRRAEAAEKYGIETVADIDEGLAFEPSLIVVSTPPDLHERYARMAAERGIHVFVEAGILDTGAAEIVALAQEHGSLAAPSCTMRFFPGPKKLEALLASGELGRPLTFTYHAGQHLEDWHPWESIRDFYVSKPETGACREIVPFELMWLVDVFGAFGKVTGLRGRYGELDAEIDDVYHCLVETADGATSGHVLVDVVSRPYVRRLRVACTGGSVEWDQNAKTLRWCRATSAEESDWQECALDESAAYEGGCVNPEAPYIDEIEAVLLAAEGKKAYPVDFVEEAQVLGLLYAAERESDRLADRDE